jgi:flagellar hook protein FlgE
MIQSMNSAVSGLNAQQTEMDVIGDDIANVSTYGFQSETAMFESALVETDEGATAPTGNSGGSNPIQEGLGVQVGSIETSETQGALTTTGNPSDLAVDGSGFFVLGSGAQQYYTRNGNFQLNSNSALVTSNGLSVMGWMANGSGVVNSNQPVSALSIPLGSTLIAQASANAVMQGNLNSGTAVGGTVTSAINLYDSLGNSVTATLTFTNTGPDAWTWTATGPAGGPALAGNGTLTFSSAGVMTASTGGPIAITNTDGAVTPQDVAVNFGAMSQLSSSSTASPLSQDGYGAGNLTSYNVGTDGTITGTYSNGITQTIGQVALATFANPGGLTQGNNGNLQISANSGVANIGTAETGGRGEIQSGTLESSNVNLADQFTSMITAERAYQADSQVITVADQMLQDLIQLQSQG